MKKFFLAIALAAVSLSAAADEGMWLLPYIQKMNIRDMKKYGCKLTADDIYSADKSSLKDAIVIFGRGCTGEVVSPEGLVFTNHHCGYGAIQSLSSVEHDYLKYGFWAQSNAEEIPAPGLEIRFVRKIEDVTERVLGNVPSIAGGEEFAGLVKANVKALREELAERNPNREIVVREFFGGNRYFAFVIEVFKDIRLVGTPPTSIGKFGGDTDNWMWPRHTGDFSIFRIYADKDNKPAAYSPDNVPYKAEKFLKISLDGYKPNDFAMIMGFPGSTQRYMTSYEIDEMLDVQNPQRIFIRGERQAILKKDMAASDEVRIKYASKYARSSNYWKNSIGMSRGIRRLGVKASKQAQEESFRQWAAANTLPEEGYIDALDKIRSAVGERTYPRALMQYVGEALYSIELLKPAWSLENVVKIDNPERYKTAFAGFYKDYDASTDRKVAARMLTIARENMKEVPSFYADIIDKDFGGDIAAYVDYLYDNSVFASEAATMALFDDFSAEKVAVDPATALAKSIDTFVKEKCKVAPEVGLRYADGHRKYIAGLMLQNPDKAWASDANSTIRMTYGRVLPYSPQDGVEYEYFTTLKGVIEKEDKSNPTEFTVPERLKELYAAGDYGRYADKDGTLHVGFLADCDITGGNSGSPVLNAKGELIGLAFDGNWEAMSGDVAFEPNLQRTISVDVRYVLFVIDKFAGASWLLDEMEIVKR